MIEFLCHRMTFEIFSLVKLERVRHAEIMQAHSIFLLMNE